MSQDGVRMKLVASLTTALATVTFFFQAQRRSRWGSETEKVDINAPVSVPVPGASNLTSLRRTDPALIQYALKVFGTTDIEEHQWKQCEDQIKVKYMWSILSLMRYFKTFFSGR